MYMRSTFPGNTMQCSTSPVQWVTLGGLPSFEFQEDVVRVFMHEHCNEQHMLSKSCFKLLMITL